MGMEDVSGRPRMKPGTSRSPLGWARRNLFSGVGNTVLTLVSVYILWMVIPPLLDFTIFSAVWTGTTREACLVPDAGACWPFVWANIDQFIYGRYPPSEIWRVNIVFALGIATIVPMLIPAAPAKRFNLIFLLVVYPLIALVLLAGDRPGLPPVPTSEWGGLLVTLVVAVTGIVVSLPLGIVLALGRRSSMPAIRMLSIVFIEFWRGVPLITVLFMASVMLPLFLPEGLNPDNLLRCLVGVALFSSAYMAEVVRGGLQAIPAGQYEAARAVGLGYWQAMIGVVLPQALRHVIPGIVNTFIGLFKDTTLVLIVGIFDLLGQVRAQLSDPNWTVPQGALTGYIFAALVFWVFCFGMSQYSNFMERRLNTGHER
ncbi:amino acid ABC transporter permease [Parvibaculum sp.]|uniref:amino acid ABC transporter permease n=1 Tax=Parvibaculum sp. TaxID=2024848 RepID=UPI00272F41DF|nr:amino acid ABC transporter permease [Parvibaculum sp.]MDP1628180.1 amino acid ABC transporter permease [Parvibaculum sp.]MDP2148020.1 amino acid ABC transporter permease [Parvibaculum sp.]MDP3326908.1 amino acid ABC transporter permease [Parvibaculum sp.]